MEDGDKLCPGQGPLRLEQVLGHTIHQPFVQGFVDGFVVPLGLQVPEAKGGAVVAGRAGHLTAGQGIGEGGGADRLLLGAGLASLLQGVAGDFGDAAGILPDPEGDFCGRIAAETRDSGIGQGHLPVRLPVHAGQAGIGGHGVQSQERRVIGEMHQAVGAVLRGGDLDGNGFLLIRSSGPGPASERAWRVPAGARSIE